MTAKIARQSSIIFYTPKTIKRAERALQCSPFQLVLFLTMINTSVDLKAITLEKGINNQYTNKSITEATVEKQLMWLIQVGILRREVDGQGITNSFRLTPLGRMIMEKWQDDFGKIPSAEWHDYLVNFLLSRFSWLFSGIN
jgi:hypothetical protein